MLEPDSATGVDETDRAVALPFLLRVVFETASLSSELSSRTMMSDVGALRALLDDETLLKADESAELDELDEARDGTAFFWRFFEGLMMIDWPGFELPRCT